MHLKVSAKYWSLFSGSSLENVVCADAGGRDAARYQMGCVTRHEVLFTPLGHV